MPTELPDDAIVIRGGVSRDWEQMRDQALDAHDETGHYALSTFVGILQEGEAVDDLVCRVAEEAYIPNKQVRLTTPSQLRRAGFSLEQTGDLECHYDVRLGEYPSDAALARFVAALGEPRRNPCPTPRPQ